MNRDETSRLLRTRSALTSQPYGDDAIDAWYEALHPWTYTAARDALVDAARHDKKVSVAHVVDRLPPIERTDDDIPIHCELCDGHGLLEAPTELAHNPRTCRPDDDHPCRCHATMPCRCTAGQRRRQPLRRALDANRHELVRLGRISPQPAGDDELLTDEELFR